MASVVEPVVAESGRMKAVEELRSLDTSSSQSDLTSSSSYSSLTRLSSTVYENESLPDSSNNALLSHRARAALSAVRKRRSSTSVASSTDYFKMLEETRSLFNAAASPRASLAVPPCSLNSTLDNKQGYLPGFAVAGAQHIDSIHLHAENVERGEFVYRARWVGDEVTLGKFEQLRRAVMGKEGEGETRVRCDGPCGEEVRAGELREFGRCDHSICRQCMKRAGDGSCVADACYKWSLADRCPNDQYRRACFRQLVSTGQVYNSLAANKAVESVAASVTLMHMSQPGNHIHRTSMEREMSATTTISDLCDMAKDKCGRATTVGWQLFTVSTDAQQRRTLTQIDIAQSLSQTLGELSTQGRVRLLIDTAGIF